MTILFKKIEISRLNILNIENMVSVIKDLWYIHQQLPIKIYPWNVAVMLTVTEVIRKDEVENMSDIKATTPC